MESRGLQKTFFFSISVFLRLCSGSVPLHICKKLFFGGIKNEIPIFGKKIFFRQIKYTSSHLFIPKASSSELMVWQKSSFCVFLRMCSVVFHYLLQKTTPCGCVVGLTHYTSVRTHKSSFIPDH